MKIESLEMKTNAENQSANVQILERNCIGTQYPKLRVVPHFSSLAWGDFHARSRFARSSISEEKWGTTRSLSIPSQKKIQFTKDRDLTP